MAAPAYVDDDAVRLAVVARLGWIRRRQAEFRGQDRQSPRRLVSGESHYVDGRRYRLAVVEHDAPPAVRLRNRTTMELRVRPGTDRDTREAVLQRWYRRRIRDRVPALLAAWEPRVGVHVAEVRIRRMKTRWGTCNAAARRIWLNLELARKPPSCLEYIAVHEMVHFLERRHNDRFREADGRNHAALAHPPRRAEPRPPGARGVDVLKPRVRPSPPPALQARPCPASPLPVVTAAAGRPTAPRPTRSPSIQPSSRASRRSTSATRRSSSATAVVIRRSSSPTVPDSA